MGLLDDLLRAQQEKHDAEAAIVQERLTLLKKTAETKLNLYKEQMKSEFYEAQDRRDSYSIVGRQARFFAQYRVNIREGVEPQIEEALRSFFTFDRHNLAQALKHMVMGALKEVIPTASVGEQHLEQFFIVPYNNAIVRVDLRGWKYTFSSSGIIGSVDNAFCMIVSRSIINSDLLNKDELIYFVSEALQGAPIEVVSDYIQELIKVWNMIAALREPSGSRRMLLKSPPAMSQLLEPSEAALAASGWIGI